MYSDRIMLVMLYATDTAVLVASVLMDGTVVT